MHFCGVLLIAAMLSIPRQTPTSLAVCAGAAAWIAGLALSTWWCPRRAGRARTLLSDWIWHVAMSLAA